MNQKGKNWRMFSETKIITSNKGDKILSNLLYNFWFRVFAIHPWCVLISLILSTVIFIVFDINQFSYILLLTAGIYSLTANGTILMRLFRKRNFKLAGGSVAHIGIAMMLLGILFSAGYSKVISMNNSG